MKHFLLFIASILLLYCDGKAQYSLGDTYKISNLTVSDTQVWENKVVELQGYLHIGAGGNLTLKNVKMKCGKNSIIRVFDNFLELGTHGGVLTIDNSEIGLCDSGWKGIEVHGWIDACPADYGIQGRMVMNNSTISHADIAVFVGTRESPVPPNDRRMHGGGTIEITSDTFRDNYVDIMFSEYNLGGACNNCDLFPPSPGWVSMVHNNLFDTQAVAERCDSFASTVIMDYQNAWNSHLFGTPPMPLPPPSQPEYCHIVDFNLVPMAWTWPYLGGPNMGSCEYNFETTNPITLWPNTANGFWTRR
ncbi:MAG: hypothetical protein LRY55_00085 [Leadbetterella sp.]|nr:hypothetical protein [Leadbetterella sp.]